MKESFWHGVWERNSIGFHQNQYHAFLEAILLPRLQESDERVFVPLCGKSDDMVWLAEHMSVVGSELSDIACNDFFLEKDIYPTIKACDKHKLYQFKNITLYQGDFFSLKLTEQSFNWLYDRAALIALPLKMRQRYVDKLTSFMGNNSQLLLISLEFPENELVGPPFAIFEQDIKSLFSGFKVECIAEQKLEDKRFAQRVFNVGYLKERAYLITRCDHN